MKLRVGKRTFEDVEVPAPCYSYQREVDDDETVEKWVKITTDKVYVFTKTELHNHQSVKYVYDKQNHHGFFNNDPLSHPGTEESFEEAIKEFRELLDK